MNIVSYEKINDNILKLFIVNYVTIRETNFEEEKYWAFHGFIQKKYGYSIHEISENEIKKSFLEWIKTTEDYNYCYLCKKCSESLEKNNPCIISNKLYLYNQKQNIFNERKYDNDTKCNSCGVELYLITNLKNKNAEESIYSIYFT